MRNRQSSKRYIANLAVNNIDHFIIIIIISFVSQMIVTKTLNVKTSLFLCELGILTELLGYIICEETKIVKHTGCPMKRSLF